MFSALLIPTLRRVKETSLIVLFQQYVVLASADVKLQWSVMHPPFVSSSTFLYFCISPSYRERNGNEQLGCN